MYLKLLFLLTYAVVAADTTGINYQLAEERPPNIDQEVWNHILKDRSKNTDEWNTRYLTNKILVRDSVITLLPFMGILVFIFFNVNRTHNKMQRRNSSYFYRGGNEHLKDVKRKSSVLNYDILTKFKSLKYLLNQLENKDTQLDVLNSKLRTLYADKSKETLGIINQRFSSDKEWLTFKHNFEQIHTRFFENLMTIHPSLTTYELRLCALLKLNLSSKEIGNTLNISASSVNTARYRIRKKMRLGEEDDLIKHLLLIS